jgi:hypothetical protein
MTTTLDGLSRRIEHATLPMLDEVSRDIWRALSAGLLGDDDAQRCAEMVQGRRDAVRSRALPGVAAAHGGDSKRPRSWSYFPLKKPAQRSPDRQRSITRRRQLAASGPMPPSLAAQFTTGELAVLRIVADEVSKSGQCSRTLPEIAARAGVSDTTARKAIRLAARLGLLTIEERRRHNRPNLANAVRVVSAEWAAWIRHGQRSRRDGREGEVFASPRIKFLLNSQVACPIDPTSREMSGIKQRRKENGGWSIG